MLLANVHSSPCLLQSHFGNFAIHPIGQRGLWFLPLWIASTSDSAAHPPYCIFNVALNNSDPIIWQTGWGGGGFEVHQRRMEIMRKGVNQRYGYYWWEGIEDVEGLLANIGVGRRQGGWYPIQSQPPSACVEFTFFHCDHVGFPWDAPVSSHIPKTCGFIN